jgi:hypothetical protein
MFVNSMTNSFGLTPFQGSPLNPPKGDFLVTISRSFTPNRLVISARPLKRPEREEGNGFKFKSPSGGFRGLPFRKKICHRTYDPEY